MNAERNLKLFLEKGYVTSRDRKLSLLFPFYTSHIAQGVFSKISTKTGSPVDTDSKVTPSVTLETIPLLDSFNNNFMDQL